MNMGEEAKRVLFVNSEIFPYLPESELANIGRHLPQGIQERGMEIRSFMPRFGCINERKNQLHEVIRLSGMNIIINNVDRPLVIKVASIAATRMQVYFIDNEDYFKRKQVYADENGKFFEDNVERAVFFARGVLETVKKLRWEPDIIHCHGWITHFLPVYLKKEYKDDPIFKNSKVFLSLYNDLNGVHFTGDMKKTGAFGKITEYDLSLLSGQNEIDFAKLAAQYSDGIAIASENIDPELKSFCKGLNLPILELKSNAFETGKYIEEYHDFYNNL